SATSGSSSTTRTRMGSRSRLGLRLFRLLLRLFFRALVLDTQHLARHGVHDDFLRTRLAGDLDVEGIHELATFLLDFSLLEHAIRDFGHGDRQRLRRSDLRVRLKPWRLFLYRWNLLAVRGSRGDCQ